MSSGAAVPVEVLLKLALDKAGSKQVQDFLDHQESSFGRMEQAVGRIGDGLAGAARTALGIAGIAGVSSIVGQFMGVSQAGSNVGLAAGHVTGGSNVWHPYGQSMLAAQAKTGVQASAIAQGLILAVQQAGGTPTPAQAAILGGLVAGIGQTDGMSPSQVAQVFSPLLQATNKSLTAGNLLGVASTLQGGLTAFPGSQAAPMLALLSQLGVSQALGVGPAGGFTPNLHGLTAAVNTAAQANGIWRNPSITGGALTSISGGLQNAFGNPSQEAFMQMAGISYQDQRAGFTPQNMQRIMAEATRMYGSGNTRDIALRSMFGLQGADLLETFAPGTKAASALDRALSHPSSARHLAQQIQHAQQRTTPSATANSWGAKILGWLFASPEHALLGAGGALLGGKLLKGGLSKGLGALRGAGAGSAAEDAAATAGGDAVGGDLGSLLFGGVGAGIGAVVAALASPDSAGPSFATGGLQSAAARKVLQMAAAKFGPRNLKSTRARNWMQAQLYSGSHDTMRDVYGMAALDQYGFGASQKLRKGTGQMLDNALGDQWATDPFSKLASSMEQLDRTIQKLAGGRGLASYTGRGQGAEYASYLGTQGIQALSGMGASAEFAALSGGLSGGGTSLAASYFGGATSVPVSTRRPVASGGGQPCTLTWYDPALGGTNSSNGQANPHSGMANGAPYEASAMTCAAPPQYSFGTKIQFTYQGKSVTCTVTDRGGAITGAHFDLSRGAANTLGMISAGVVHATFRVLSSGSAHGSTGGSSGSSSGGGSPPSGQVLRALAAATGPLANGASGSAVAGYTGHPASGQPIHVHVHVDGRQLRATRVLLGHKA